VCDGRQDHRAGGAAVIDIKDDSNVTIFGTKDEFACRFIERGEHGEWSGSASFAW
jgi:hypothetical protein